MYYCKNIDISSCYFSDRLLKYLSSISDYNINLVEAPHGFGKTTAINHYLEKSDFKNIIRLTLTESVIPLFFENILFSLKSYSDNPKVILAYLNNPKRTEKDFLKTLTSIKLSTKTIIVINCTQPLPHTCVNTFILKILASCPPNLTFIVELQSKSPYQFCNTLINNRLNYIGSSAFILTGNDIKKYFKLLGITLTEDEASALYISTNGKIEYINFYLNHYIQTKELNLSFNANGISLIFQNKNFILNFFKKLFSSCYMSKNPFPIEVLFFIKENSLFNLFLESILEDLRKNNYSEKDKKDILHDLNILISVFDSLPSADYFDKSHNPYFTKYKLTQREFEIVKLVSKRYSNKEIANELYLSESTVKSYMKIIFRKIGITSRKEIFNKF